MGRDGARSHIYHGIVSKGKTAYELMLVDSVGKFRAIFIAGSDTSTARANAEGLAANTWNHIVGVKDATQNVTKIYLNGTWIDDANSPLLSIPTADDVFIGARSTDSSRFFNGTIDEVLIFNKALSARRPLLSQ